MKKVLVVAGLWLVLIGGLAYWDWLVYGECIQAGNPWWYCLRVVG